MWCLILSLVAIGSFIMGCYYLATSFAWKDSDDKIISKDDKIIFDRHERLYH